MPEFRQTLCGTISHYRIVEMVGDGTGLVCKTEDARRQPTVAQKFLPQELGRIVRSAVL